MSAVDGPAAPGALVGRDAERVRLAALLGGDRLVCVTGPGGVGKTHLVLAVVADQADDDPRHTVFCPLAEIEQAHAVRHAVAARLGVLNVDDPLGASLPVTPDGPGLLVVLDNCEHVIDAAAAVAEELLAAGPHVRVLATSREPLHLPGERVLSLRPLPVPADAAERGAADSPAVVLFTQRAQRARDGFSLDEATLPAVVEICRALDGLPLALEIAGARVRSLGVADIAARLGQRFTLLRASTRRAPARHRDLRAVVEWSYGLLDPAERTLFDRMSVYPAGFDVPAVLAAAAAVGLAAGPALEALDGLVTKSLVTVHDQADGTRYGLLETLRAYGLERLEAAGDLASARDQHAEHYAALGRRLWTTGLHEWSTALGQLFWELDNLRSALAWSLAADATPDRSFDLLAPLWYVGLQQSSREVVGLCDQAVARWPAARGHPRYSEVQAAASVALLALDDLPGARARALDAIEAATSLVGVALAWRTVAETSHHSGRPDEAMAELEAADEAAQAAGFEPLRCDLLGLRTAMLAQSGRAAEAWDCAQRALALATEQGNVYEHAWDLHLVGLLLVDSQPARAREWLTAALAESQALHYPYGVRASMRGLASVATVLGDLPAAADWSLRSLDHFTQGGMRLQRCTSGAAAVPLLLAAGRRDTAVLVVSQLDVTEAVVEHLSAPGFDAARRAVRADASAADAATRGRALSSEQVLAVLRRELHELARRAPDLPGAPGGAAPAAAGAAVGAAPAAAAAAAAPASPATAELARAGALWRVTYAGTTVHVPALKGVADLAVLLDRPGREVPALDLAAARGDRLDPRDGVNGEEPGTLSAPGDLGETVDAQARAAYAARIRQLQRDLDDADAAGDPARAVAAQLELDALTEHLAAAYGLRGARRSGDPAERARAAVTARLRAALAKVREVHPQLGRHLDRSIRTGRFCSYHPDDPVVWTVQTHRAHPVGRPGARAAGLTG